MKKLFQKYFQQTAIFSDEEGAAAIEYALIASATSLALVASLPSVKSGLSSTYNAIVGFF